MPRGSKPGERRGGRKRGTPNKATAALKDAILRAYEDAGGVSYLERIAREKPHVFCALLGRLIPHTVAGDNKAPAVIEVQWLPPQ